MKIIFLDIDDVLYFMENGVQLSSSELNTLRNQLKNKYSSKIVDSLKDKSILAFLNFKPLAMEYLKKLCQEEYTKVVISSTWRYSHSQEQLQALFSIYDLDDRIIGCTPDIDINNRGEEIESWLRLHITQVDAYVILDDWDACITPRLSNHFVYCPKGFNFEYHFEEANQILNTPLRGGKSLLVQFFESANYSMFYNLPILIRPYEIVEYSLINQSNQSKFIETLWETARIYHNPAKFIFDNLNSQSILELLSFFHERKTTLSTMDFLNCKSDLGNVLKDWISKFPYQLHLKITWKKFGFDNILLEAILSNKNITLEFHYAEYVFWEINHKLIGQLEKESRIDWALYEPGISKPISFKFSYSENGSQFFKVDSSQKQSDLNASNQIINRPQIFLPNNI